MKLIHFMFTIYMMTLSVYPCYEDKCSEEISHCIDTESSDNQNGSPDLCTPFCIGNCCYVLDSGEFSLINQDKLPDSVRAIIPNTEKLTSLVAAPIWQPPKLT